MNRYLYFVVKLSHSFLSLVPLSPAVPDVAGALASLVGTAGAPVALSADSTLPAVAGAFGLSASPTGAGSTLAVVDILLSDNTYTKKIVNEIFVGLLLK